MTKKVMTKEIQEQLAGFLPMKVSATWEFIPTFFRELDIPQKYKPFFEVRQLDKGQLNKVRTELVPLIEKDEQTTKDIEKAEKIITDTISESLVSWGNLYSVGDGEEIEYKNDKKIIDGFPQSLKMSILREIMKITGYPF